MPTLQKFNQFVEDLAKGVHDLSSDVIRVMLCNAANAPLATYATVSDLTTITMTNLDNSTMTVTSAEQTDGVLNFICEDLTLLADGGDLPTFRYVVIYNTTPTSPNDPLIAWLDIGEDVTLTNTQSRIINFDQVNGLFDLQ